MGMVLVLCADKKQARQAFFHFKNHLEANEPWVIKTIFPYSYSLETDDDIRYVFLDYHLEHVFDSDRPDVLYVGDFFRGLYAY